MYSLVTGSRLKLPVLHGKHQTDGPADILLLEASSVTIYYRDMMKHQTCPRHFIVIASMLFNTQHNMITTHKLAKNVKMFEVFASR